MKSIKAFAITSCLALLAVAFLPSSKADEWNKKTILTVNEPLAVPGKVLQPGKYVMKLMESPADRHIVQIFNEDETQLQTTVVAIPNYRLEPTDKTQFAFWETPTGQPRALKAWFYPGDNFGQEFAYPKELATTIAQTNNQAVPTVGTDNSGQITQTTPSGESQPMANCNCTTPPSGQSSAAAQPATPSTNEQNNSNGQSTIAQSTTPNTTESNPGMNAQNQSDNGTAASSGTTSSNQSATTTNSAGAEQNSASSSATANQNANEGMNDGASSTSANQTNQQAGTQANTGTNLPRTASPFPLVGLAGLLSLGGALGARVLAKRIA